VSSGLTFWNGTEGFANWAIIPYTRRETERNAPHTETFPSSASLKKCMLIALRRDAARLLNWKWRISSAILVLAIVPQTEFSLSTKSRNVDGMLKMTALVLSTTKNNTTESLRNSFRGRCGSVVLASACYCNLLPVKSLHFYSGGVCVNDRVTLQISWKQLVEKLTLGEGRTRRMIDTHRQSKRISAWGLLLCAVTKRELWNTAENCQIFDRSFSHLCLWSSTG